MSMVFIETLPEIRLRKMDKKKQKKNATMKASVTQPQKKTTNKQNLKPFPVTNVTNLSDFGTRLLKCHASPNHPQWSFGYCLKIHGITQHSHVVLEKLCQALEGLTELHHFEHVFVDQLPAAVRHLLGRATDTKSVFWEKRHNM